ISNTVFQNNDAFGNAGAINCYFSSINLSHCTLNSNSASEAGGIYISYESFADISNSIISFSAVGEGIKYFDNGYALISCSNIFGNSDGDWTNEIIDQLAFNNNMSLNPELCNSQELPYLDYGSPCAYENNIECGLIGALPADCGATDVLTEISKQIIFDVSCFPNPFNPSTTIQFTLESPELTTVAIYDISGELVKTILQRNLTPQTYNLIWNGENSQSKSVASGNYLYRITTNQYQKTGRLTLIK
ncbi:T9SS type A sorting domain-containing protein, partial [bacterium]|nr:T9SS type A sorting domain-containing protein [bacterium]